MKKILQILLFSVVLLGCNSQKHITSLNQVGEKFFQITHNIGKSSYLEFRQNFLSRKELINMLDDSKFPKEGEINEVYTQILNMSDEEYDSGLHIDTESYELFKEYCTSLKINEAQFIDFEVEKQTDESDEFAACNARLTWKIIGDEDKLERGYCIFIIYNEVYYLLGFD